MSTAPEPVAPPGGERQGRRHAIDVPRVNGLVSAMAGGAVLGANIGTIPALVGAVAAGAFVWVCDARRPSPRSARGAAPARP